MKYQVISIAVGKDAERIMKKHPKIKELIHAVKGSELFVDVEYIKDLTNTIKQNVVVCHDEDVIHIFDQKIK